MLTGKMSTLSETPVIIYHCTRRLIPQEMSLHKYRVQKLRSRLPYIFTNLLHGAEWVRKWGCIGSWWGNRREGDHWRDLGIDGWKILGWISRRWDVGIWTGLVLPRIERVGGRL